MKRLFTYPFLVFRRMLKSWPAVFLMTLLLAGAVGLVAWQQAGVQSEDGNQAKLRLGVIGKSDGSYLGFDYSEAISLDTSAYTLELVECADEEEAKRGVEDGSLVAYLVVPHGFVAALSNGQNLPVKLVIGGTQGGLGSQLLEEVSSAASALVSNMEAGIYAAMDFYTAHGYADRAEADGDILNITYLGDGLRREELYKVTPLTEETGDFFDYYLSAALISLLLFFGMNGASLLLVTDMAMTRLLRLRGLPVLLQCLGEYLSYVLFHLFVLGSLLCTALLGTGIHDALAKDAPALFAKLTGFFTPRLLLALVAAAACLSALHYLLFSGVSRLLEGLLLSFAVFIGLGYISGLFYPTSFFPKTLRALAAFLPTNAAREEVASILAGSWRFSESLPRMLLLLVWGLLFLAGGYLLRRRRCLYDD